VFATGTGALSGRPRDADVIIYHIIFAASRFGSRIVNYGFIKEFTFGNASVKLAIRATKNGVLFVRSLYVVSGSRIDNYIKKGTVKVLT
jgi:hypothetical protein